MPVVLRLVTGQLILAPAPEEWSGHGEGLGESHVSSSAEDNTKYIQRVWDKASKASIPLWDLKFFLLLK